MALKPGDMHDGYVFQGGDPNAEGSWKPIALDAPATLQFGPFDTGIGMPDWLSRGVEGVGRGMVNVGRHVRDLTGFGEAPSMSDLITGDSPKKREAALDAALMNTRAGSVGNLIGEGAALTPVMLGGEALAGAGMLGRAGLAAVENPIALGAIEGAGQGALMSDEGNRLKGALTGAVTGAALPAAVAGGKKLVNGITRTPEAQLLLDRGVDLTPGQMNPRGLLNQVEQAPLVSNFTKGARASAEADAGRAFIQEAAAPGAAPIPNGDIHAMLQAAQDSYKPLYDQAKGFPMHPAIYNVQGGSVPLGKALQRAVDVPGVSDSARKSASAQINDLLTRLKSLDSDNFLELRSAIRALGRDANLASDTLGKDKAKIFGKAADTITQSLESQLPQDALTALKLADSKYGTYKMIEDAVARSKDNLAGLTPSKVSQAIAAAIPDAAYAKGAGGALRDMAKAGHATFEAAPKTGFAVPMTAAAGYAAAHAPAVAAPVGLGYLAAVNSQTGRRLFQGSTKAQQLAKALGVQAGQKIDPRLLAVADQLAQRGLVSLGQPVPFTPTR